jgi:hypothetical protein
MIGVGPDNIQDAPDAVPGAMVGDRETQPRR